MNKVLKDSEEIKRLLLTSVEEIELPRRAVVALKRGGYRIVMDLVSNLESEKDLCRIDGMGKTLAKTITDRIHALGLSFSYESLDLIEREKEASGRENESLTLEERVFMENVDIALKNAIQSVISHYEYLDEMSQKYEEMRKEILRQMNLIESKESFSIEKIRFIESLLEKEDENVNIDKELKTAAASLEIERQRIKENRKDEAKLKRKYKKVTKDISENEEMKLEAQIDRMELDGTVKIERKEPLQPHGGRIKEDGTLEID